MNTTLIAVVARREIEEICTDWRMLIPMLVLTFGVPLLMVLAVLATLSYLPSAELANWLIPLSVLLCGFLPIGLSLVNASESFVGERERNTLESLLSVPVSDGEIYFGKLAAALILPACQAGLAITTFAGTFILFAPAPITGYLTIGLVGTIIGLAGLKTLVMVALTTVISIHSTTVRAANLLASFVLVPLGGLVHFESMLLTAQRGEGLLYLAALLASAAAVLMYAGLATFNREAVLAR
ncbi:MAG: hypothetical protein AVDCRST_MAG93-9631 [uncultured Chloroflexia bacterium]|uniref:Uncharacterized protein n=1 Tax=uncultured Chloroflexia bacterium TaxID=1672391 RepID=A0A6J4NJU2_9CHLR|nr:MAG: hypothetical protein AVDCRST_MAG93-9631 [uncultured Chloroflexia bacterium]